jgi:hypothetical protein
MGKTPLFDGTSYDYWKNKMCTHEINEEKGLGSSGKKCDMVDEENPTPREEEEL